MSTSLLLYNASKNTNNSDLANFKVQCVDCFCKVIFYQNFKFEIAAWLQNRSVYFGCVN
jgi:hypothetical protein